MGNIRVAFKCVGFTVRIEGRSPQMGPFEGNFATKILNAGVKGKGTLGRGSQVVPLLCYLMQVWCGARVTAQAWSLPFGLYTKSL